MGRASVKSNKTVYQLRREELGLSREQASELLGGITADHLEKIESGKISIPDPEDIFIMAEKYKDPNLYNYYCANQCPIGRHYVPEIKINDLTQVVLDMLDSLNSIEADKNRLIQITHDGAITPDEIHDFVLIQKELERISLAVDGMRLWSERMLSAGLIDQNIYDKFYNK